MLFYSPSSAKDASSEQLDRNGIRKP
ncbi:hypothetical protein RSAG8_04607, partial [Rhizoctonia solani AG-8 WAC10335]